MHLFTHQSSHPKFDAQRNLEGITHYVDDQTLRYHKSRILSTHITDNGLLLALVESVALDPQGRSRGFRPVIFDIFGTVLSRVDLEACFKTSAAAEKAMWAELEKIDAKAVTLAAIREQKKTFAEAMQSLTEKVRAL